MEKVKEKLKSHPGMISWLFFILGACLLVYLTNNLFVVFAPFIIAYVVTRILRPIMVKIRSKIKIPNAINTIICMILFGLVTGLIIWLFVHYLVRGVSYVVGLLSSESTINTIVVFAQDAWVELENVIEFFNINISSNDLSSVIADFAKKVITLVSDVSIGLVTQIPNLLVSLIIGCVAAFYMLYDYDKLSASIKRQLPEKARKITDVINYQVLSSFIKMIFSYVLISAICFVELLLGFMILGIKDSAFIALIIAILDVLPILGSGAILIPWGVISMFMGDPIIGVGLLILWGVIAVVRQVLEPKIVGAQIGLHPLVTLISLYVGLRLMGGLGLIVGPLYILACKKLNEAGLIKLYKTKNKAEINNTNPDVKN